MYRKVKEEKWKKLFLWQAKDAKQLYLPTFLLESVYGLRVLEYPLGHRRTSITLLYVLTIWTLLPYLMTLSWSYLYVNGPQAFFDTFLNKLIDSSNTLTTIVFVITGCLNSKLTNICIKRIGIVDDTLASIGFGIDYPEQLKFNALCALSWIVYNFSMNWLFVLGMRNDISMLIYFLLSLTNQLHHVHTLTFMVFGIYIRYCDRDNIFFANNQVIY